MPMQLRHPHPWTVSFEQAREIQLELRDRVIRRDRHGPIRTVAGVDVGLTGDRQFARAAVSVLSFPELTPVAAAVARRKMRFPYVPGYLSFREIPAVLAALDKLSCLPDLILCDGQGTAHPRRFGIACHLGVLTDLPTIGVGKTRLCGSFTLPGPRKGDWSPLKDGSEVIGCVLRTRDGTKPVFVSIGHRVSLAGARELVLACCPRYRLPETTRTAHRLASGGAGGARDNRSDPGL